jgi:hypothetical protein
MTSGAAHLVPPGPAANWRQGADAAPALAEPITVAEWWKNRRGESIRLVLNRFEGRDIFGLAHLVHRRRQAEAGERLCRRSPALPRLAAAIAKAEAKARELGLIGDKGTGDE